MPQEPLGSLARRLPALAPWVRVAQRGVSFEQLRERFAALPAAELGFDTLSLEIAPVGETGPGVTPDGLGAIAPLSGGCLVAGNQISRRPISNDDLALLTLLAGACEVALRRGFDRTRQQAADRLLALAGCLDELLGIDDPDHLCRRGVELARERLGLERCAIFLRQGDELVGTWGTDLAGRTIDEHQHRPPFDDFWRALLDADAVPTGHWRVINADLVEWTGDRPRLLPPGWVVGTPIRAGAETLGVFCNDAAISRAEGEPLLQTVLVIYCALLGQLLANLRAEAARAVREASYQRVFEHLIEGFAVFEVIWGEHGEPVDYRYLDVNRAFEQQTGLAPADCLGRLVSEVLPEGPSETFREVFARVAVTGAPESYETYSPGLRRFYEASAFQPEPGQVAAVFRDLTTRRAADAEIRLLGQVVEQMTDAVVVVGPDAGITYVNPAFSELFGYPPEAVEGQSVSLLLAPADQAELLLERYRRQAAAEKRLALDVRLRRADGSQFLADLKAGPVETGMERLWVLTIRDVTEARHQAELRRLQRYAAQALAEVTDLEDLMVRLVDVLALVGVIDCGGLYTVQSPGGLRLAAHTGLSEAFVAATARYPAGDPRVALVLGGEPFYGDFASLLTNPSPAELDEGLRALAVVPLRHEGQVVGALNLASRLHADIPEDARTAIETIAAQVGSVLVRLQAETARRQSEENLRHLFDSVEDLIFILDNDGRIVHLNAAVTDRLGYLPTELLGQSILLLHSSQQVEAARAALKAALAGATEPLHIPLVSRAGHVIPVETRLIRGRWDGRPVFVGVSRDLTERERLEAARRETEALLQQASRLEAVGQLAGGVAHEFNNLLTSIIGYTNFVLDTVEPDDPRQADLHQIQRAAERAADLTGQLLAFSRRQPIQPRRLDLNATVRTATRLLRPLLGERVELLCELTDDPATVLADPGQIEQILMNLAVNARDAMPEGGRLLFRTTTARLMAADAERLGPLPSGEYVCLEVTDTGCGMDADTLAHIFEPFFTTKEVGQGTGLGLATVYGVVTQNGWGIECDSAPGRGTTFRLWLPRQRESAEEPERRGPAAPVGGHETILLVEDDPAVRAISARTLARLGYEVLPAATGEEALALATGDGRAIDMLITDVIMPGLTGLEVADRLRELIPGLPVLFVTGHAEDVLARQGIVAPGLDFLQKPFSRTELAARVRQGLAGRPLQGG